MPRLTSSASDEKAIAALRAGAQDYLVKGWADSEPLGQYLAENHGVAIVPGAFFSPFGNDWVRFSYATPAERTEGAFKRLVEGLNSLKS